MTQSKQQRRALLIHAVRLGWHDTGFIPGYGFLPGSDPGNQHWLWGAPHRIVARGLCQRERRWRR